MLGADEREYTLQSIVPGWNALAVAGALAAHARAAAIDAYTVRARLCVCMCVRV